MFYLILFTLSLSLNLSGCMSGTMMVNNHIAKKNAKLDREASIRSGIKQRARFEEMKAAGDPQGYYFSAIAYALDNKDKEENKYEVKRRYEEAIAKGSNDAKVALGNLLIMGELLPFGYIGGPFKDELDFKKGIRLLEEANAQSCIFKQPIDSTNPCRDGSARNTASLLYVFYRDGVYTRKAPSKEWQTLAPKDKERAAYWKKKRDICEVEVRKYNRECYQGKRPIKTYKD